MSQHLKWSYSMNNLREVIYYQCNMKIYKELSKNTHCLKGSLNNKLILGGGTTFGGRVSMWLVSNDDLLWHTQSFLVHTPVNKQKKCRNLQIKRQAIICLPNNHKWKDCEYWSHNKTEVAADLFFQWWRVHPSAANYWKSGKRTWFNASVIAWILRCGRAT